MRFLFIASFFYYSHRIYFSGYSTDESGLILWTVKECIIKACGISLQQVQLRLLQASSSHKTALFQALIPPNNGTPSVLYILTTTLTPRSHPLLSSDSVALSLTMSAPSSHVPVVTPALQTHPTLSLSNGMNGTPPSPPVELANGLSRQKKGVLVSEFTTASTLIGVSTLSQHPTTDQSSASSSQGSSEKLLGSMAEQCLRQFLERSTSALPNSYSLKIKYFKSYPLSMSTTTTTTRPQGTEHALHIALFFQQLTEKIASFLAEVYLLGKGGVRRKTATIYIDAFPCSETDWPTSTLQKLKNLSSANNTNNHV